MTDDELILFYYNDGLRRDERQAITDALAKDPGLAERYRALVAELGALTDPAVPGPGSNAVARWHAALDRATGAEPARHGKRSLHGWSIAFGAALAAALAVGIGLGLLPGGRDAPEPVDSIAAAEDRPATRSPSEAFLRGLRVHLRESRIGLESLPQDDAAGRTMLIMNILEQNRLYERAAELNDAGQLARVLRAFELVLLELAIQDIPADEAAALCAKLLFEFDAMLTKLDRRPSETQRRI